MQKLFKVFIDHAFTADKEDGLFAKKIADRFKSIKQEFDVKTFAEFIKSEFQWEEETINAINESDIIIPIISPDYLAFVTPKIEEVLNKISLQKNKYLFPILYRPADWASNAWLVRSKIIPENNISIIENSDKDVDRIINELVSIVKVIITKPETSSKDRVEKKTIKATDEKVVFISHDHDDADFAELLKLQLEKNGIVGWIDSERLKIGQDWREEIDVSITNSIAVIAIMTPEARKSEYVTYEWAFAWGKEKKIFPLMLKQTQLHPRLESLQYLDFTKRASRPYEKLINSIKELIDN